jgi:hypothetical protein
MPVNPNACDKDVKACFLCHTACHKKRSMLKTGSFLNQYIETDDIYFSQKFESQKKYLICFNLCWLLDNKISKQLKKRRPKETPILKVNDNINKQEDRATRRINRGIICHGIFDEQKVKK